MIWYIALKDIKAFYQAEKIIFLWLVFCMICGSFVLNYSYSFARYRGELYENGLGVSAMRYQVNGVSSTDDYYGVIEEISRPDFPQISNYQFFTSASNGRIVAGSSFISKQTGTFTGIWTEGYASEIDRTETNACAVNYDMLDYAGRLKMVGETFDFDDKEYVIRGVYEHSSKADIVIFDNTFAEIYGSAQEMWMTFSERLSEKQENELEKIIKNKLPDCRITFPPAKGTVSSDIVKSNELEYTAIIVMLIICIVSIIKYWQQINTPTYSVYWINGAIRGTMMKLALCESFILCTSTYLFGLGLNALLRLVVSKSASLKLFDICLGFGIFFGVFVIFTLINTTRIFKTLSVTKLRRD